MEEGIEQWKSVIADMAAIVKDLKKNKEVESKSKKRKDNLQIFSIVISILLGLIFLITLIRTPFAQQATEITEIQNDVKTIQQYLWIEEYEKSKDYLENPFTNREVKMSLYGSEMYCDLAQR